MAGTRSGTSAPMSGRKKKHRWGPKKLIRNGRNSLRDFCANVRAETKAIDGAPKKLIRGGMDSFRDFCANVWAEKKAIDEATNNFLPQHVHFCGEKMSIFCVPSVTVSAQTVAQKSLNESLPLSINSWGPIYGFIHPDSGREVPERVPATTYQFFGPPSMAFFSSQTLAQKSLNESLPPRINFLVPHLWPLFPPGHWHRSP